MNTKRLFHATWFIPFFWLNTAILGFLSLIVSIWSIKGSRRFARIWAMLNARASRIDIQVQGLEHLPATDHGGMVVASNHRSSADIGAVLVGLPLDVCWVTKNSLTQIPFLGWHLKKVHIPVTRNPSGNTMRFLRDGAKKIKDGAAVVIFPEGTRNRGKEKLLPFKRGAFVLAHASRQPIVPVAVIGSADVWPPGTLFPVPGQVILRIGPAIETTGYTGKQLDQLAEDTRRAISDLLPD